jgi:predicted SnoaL-like aldol condensation-catalyzing enzyme
MSTATRKSIAVDFLRLAREGKRIAAERLIAPGARHHSAYFPAGMSALLDAIEDAARTAPDRTSEVKLVVAEGDYVVVHSHVRPRPDDLGASVVHIFRFDGDRVVELWDVGQPVPVDTPNGDGMF